MKVEDGTQRKLLIDISHLKIWAQPTSTFYAMYNYLFAYTSTLKLYTQDISAKFLATFTCSLETLPSYVDT